MDIELQNELAQLAQDGGIHFMHEVNKYGMAQDSISMTPNAGSMGLNTYANSGVLNMFTTYYNPKQIDMLYAPTRATKLLPEQKMGDWTDLSAVFALAEQTGQTSSYGDYNENGSSGANFNYESRQQFYFQTMVELGEREVAIAAKGRIDLIANVHAASLNAINRFANKSYFYGVNGLKNHGILNDPDLPDAITPKANAAGKTSWDDKEATEIFDDIVDIISEAVSLNDGLVDLENISGCFAISPNKQKALMKTNIYKVQVRTLVKESFPNLEFVVAPEYSSKAGEIAQLVLDNIEGQSVGGCYFSDKLRSHAVIQQSSSYKQKKSAGTWGAVISQPTGIITMVGV